MNYLVIINGQKIKLLLPMIKKTIFVGFTGLQLFKTTDLEIETNKNQVAGILISCDIL